MHSGTSTYKDSYARNLGPFLSFLRRQPSSSSSPTSSQLPNHPLPPPRSKSPHGPNDNQTSSSEESDDSEEPAITDGLDERLRQDGAAGGENVAEEVVDGDAGAGATGHEFGEHGGGHGEDEHGADAEEEVADQGDEPERVAVRRPAVPQQGPRVHDCGDPCVLPHPVLRLVGQLAVGEVPARAAGLARHDPVRPAAAEHRCQQVPDAGGDVEQADDDAGVGVRRGGEGGFEGYVQYVQRPEGHGGAVHRDQNGGEAEVEDDAERLDQEAAQRAAVFLCRLGR